MARKKPVIIWIIKQVSSIDPKFHQIEMFDPTGRRLNSVSVCWWGMFL